MDELNEQWDYAIASLAIAYQEQYSCVPTHVVRYLSELREIHKMMAEMPGAELLTVVTSHVTIVHYESLGGIMSHSPQLLLRLNRIDDAHIKCVDIEICARRLDSSADWRIVATCTIEEMKLAYGIMLEKLLNGNPFGLPSAN